MCLIKRTVHEVQQTNDVACSRHNEIKEIPPNNNVTSLIAICRDFCIVLEGWP